MDSVRTKKIKLVMEHGCSGVDCVPLMNVNPDWIITPSGIWYAQTWWTGGDSDVIRVEARGPSATNAMDRLTASVVSFT